MKNILSIFASIAIVAIIFSISVSADAQTMSVYVQSLGNAGDVLISGGAGFQPAFTTSRQLVVQGADSSTTGQTLYPTALTFTAQANSTYSVDVYILDSSSSTAGLKFGVYDINIGTGYITGIASGSKMSDTCGFDRIISDSTAGVAYTTYVPTSNYGVWQAHFVLNTTGAPAAEPVTIKFLKATSGTAIIKKGSYLEAHKQ
jgi:hypothetical protein